MAIDSVSSSTSAPAKAVQQPKPEQSAASTEEAARARQAEQQPKKSEPPKPVVNTDGQKTGQVINVTA